MNEETMKALEELAKAAAKTQGWDENNIEFSVCAPREKKSTCLICHRVYEAEIMEEPCPHCGAGFSEQIFSNEDYDQTDDYDDSEHWLCRCGEYIEDGCHCSNCNAEPPWGCPCSFCQDGEDDEDDFDDEYNW